MAYGKGNNKRKLKCMADLGHVPLHDEHRDLRERMLSALNRFAAVAYLDRVTDPAQDEKETERAMMRVQAAMAADRSLNSVWAEKARIIAKTACGEQASRRVRNLYGRFKNADTIGDRPLPDGTDRLVNFPEEWSRVLTPADLAAMTERARVSDFEETLAMFRRLRDGDDDGFTPTQANALRDMMAASEAKYKRPEWGEESEVQIHLDSRCVKGTKKALDAALRAVARGMAGGKAAPVSLRIAGAIAHGSGIRVSGILPGAVAILMRDADDEGAPIGPISLVLELTPDRVRMKAVAARDARHASLDEMISVISEDFGVANTSSLCTIRCRAGALESVLAFLRSDPDKAQMREFLTTHRSTGDVEILERIQCSGSGFLARVRKQAARVDALTSEIDISYKRHERLRGEIRRLCGEGDDWLIPQDLTPPPGLCGPDAERLVRTHKKFFALHAAIGRLRAIRRGVYAEVAGLKKSWFGHVARIRARMAIRHDAVIVAEELTFLTAERGSPDYKGPAFNRMINDGARGQYARRADATAAWLGVQVIRIPSFYTSMTDCRFGVVDAAQRRGRVFRSGADGRVMDADEHAAETIGRIPFLRPEEYFAGAAQAAAA